MDHSYEEIRAAAIDALGGRQRIPVGPDEICQFEKLACAVAEVFAISESPEKSAHRGRDLFRLSAEDIEVFREVFWDFFRQGIITLGFNNANREFPFFRLSRLGKRLLENQDTYFFHDASVYTAWLKSEVPSIDGVTLVYLSEALQAFRSGCILSATVMLGVATEHTFLLLLETIDKSPTHCLTFASVEKERTVLHKINKFKHLLDQQQKALPPAVKEDLDTHFTGILSVIRNFRNQAGHPTGKIIDRKQAYVLLHLFIPYCKKMYQLMDHFGAP